jgi:hypothetical protein
MIPSDLQSVEITGSTQTINTKWKYYWTNCFYIRLYCVSETSIPTGWKNTSASCNDEMGNEEQPASLFKLVKI